MKCIEVSDDTEPRKLICVLGPVCVFWCPLVERKLYKDHSNGKITYIIKRSWDVHFKD